MYATTSKDGQILLKIKVQPNSSKNGIEKVENGLLKIKLTSPPIEGKANKDLIKFLSKLFSIPKMNFEIIQGEKSRIKTVKISGISLENLIKKVDGELK